MDSSNQLLSLFGLFFWIFFIFSFIIIAISLWKIFTKFEQDSWKGLIPIYNIFVLLQICSLPSWYIIISLIPIANIYVNFKIGFILSKKYERNTNFGIICGLFPMIGYPILAFSNKEIVKKTIDQFSNDSDLEYNTIQSEDEWVTEALPDNEEVLSDFFTQQPKPKPTTILTEKVVEEIKEEAKEEIEKEKIKEEIPVLKQQSDTGLEYKTCPNCRNKVEATQEACFMCGARL